MLTKVWENAYARKMRRKTDKRILHILRLPIEESYLKDYGGFLGPLGCQPIPFSKSENPLMLTAEFLVSAVDPRVAAAAAKAAMEVFVAIKDEVPATENHMKNVEKASVAEKFNPTYGMANRGIASTGDCKEDDDANAVTFPASVDKKMEYIKKKEGLQIQTAAAAALASAAVKAKHLAALEERKIKSLVVLLVETQMKKLEIKPRQFEEQQAKI
ncbi:hypothetical protein GQX74_013890 [Glossina fuscipes]|nr:hypothetical protein GQX74_013890 [Glossina fuscipes]